MDVFFGEWVSLLLRWFHVIAGIAWIGASFYFIWLDNNLTEPPQWKKDQGIGGDLWAIHGGGFYEVAKYKVGPRTMPKTLHWFKWEAYSTWISGMLLMVWIYYFGAQAYMVDPSIRVLSTPAAVGLSLAFIASGWLIYEILCRTPLVASRWFTVVLLALGTLYAWALVNTFSGRAAFIQMGALIGTIMAANVLIKIIPGQRKMVAAVARGETPDPRPGLEGKQRSVHNNYFTLPVIFLMISNHYPMTYQPDYSWLILMAIVVITVVVRHYFNLSHRGIKRPLLLVCAGLAFIALAGLLSWPGDSRPRAESSANLISDDDALRLVQDKCATCHAANTTDPMFPSAAAGVRLDTMAEVERWASRSAHRIAVTRDMPFMNRTEMTEEQRHTLADWLKHRF